MSLRINSVVACCNGDGIGYKGSLPWRLKKEMAHFRNLTKGKNLANGQKNAIVMGRKTWDSLPKALPGRYNFVLSRNMKEKCDGMDGVFSSLDEFISTISSSEWSGKINDIFCIGGAEIYKILFESPYCGSVYLTRVLADFKCDVFLPSMEGFKQVITPDNIPQGEQCEDNGTKWRVEVWKK